MKVDWKRIDGGLGYFFPKYLMNIYWISWKRSESGLDYFYALKSILNSINSKRIEIGLDFSSIIWKRIESGLEYFPHYLMNIYGRNWKRIESGLKADWKRIESGSYHGIRSGFAQDLLEQIPGWMRRWRSSGRVSGWITAASATAATAASVAAVFFRGNSGVLGRFIAWRILHRKLKFFIAWRILHRKLKFPKKKKWLSFF